MVGSYFGRENYHGPQYSKYKAVLLLRPTAHLKIVPGAPQAITIFISLISPGKSPIAGWFFDLVITSGSGFPQKNSNSSNSPVPGVVDTFRREITTGTGSRFLNIFKEPTMKLSVQGRFFDRFFDLLVNRRSRWKPVLWLIFCKGNSQLGIRILHPRSFTRRFFLRWNTNQDWFMYISNVCMNESEMDAI